MKSLRYSQRYALTADREWILKTHARYPEK